MKWERRLDRSKQVEVRRLYGGQEENSTIEGNGGRTGDLLDFAF